MQMNKILIVMGLVLLLCSTALASTTMNNLNKFNMTWNSNTNQLNIGLECKGQAIGTLTLSNGMIKQFICPTSDLGQTWLIGNQSDAENLTGTYTIDAPCTTCSKTATVSTLVQSGDMQWNYWIFLLIIGLVACVGIFAFNTLKP